jgi:hypothetical protein
MLKKHKGEKIDDSWAEFTNIFRQVLLLRFQMYLSIIARELWWMNQE